jgi:hypothetical protein
MKTVLIFALGMLAAPAFASNDALVTKSSYPGYTSPDWVRTERCEVYLDKVVITRNFGYSGESGFTATETRPVTITPSILAVIERAKTEELKETPNGLCDGPGTGVSSGELVLFSTGGCGSPRLERNGGGSRMLRDLADTYCPKTYDFDGSNR